MLGSSLAAAIADMMTLPFDTARVRLQIQKRSMQGGTLQYSGMFDALTKARPRSPHVLPCPALPWLSATCAAGADTEDGGHLGSI